MDVVDLRNFYAQRLGVVARRFIGRGIRARWKDTRGMRVLGVGYATPYLGLFREEAERCLAAGAKGIKLHPRAQAFVFDGPEMEGVFAIAEEELAVQRAQTGNRSGGIFRTGAA